GCDEYSARSKKRPIREHVHKRRCHIPSADLQGNKQVGERAAEPCCQYKKNHYRTVYGHQGEVKIRPDTSAFRPSTKKDFQYRKVSVRPSELDPKQEGKE